MTNGEFFDYVMELVSRSNDTISRAFAVRQSTTVLQNLDNSPFHPWFLDKEFSGPTTQDVPTIDLPEDFLDFVEDSVVWSVNSAGTYAKLNRGFFEDIQTSFANLDSGVPEAYGIIGAVMRLGATPDDVFTIKFWYVRKSLPLADNDSNISNVWILNSQDIVAHLVAERVARYKLRNAPLADSLKKTSDELRADLFRLNESRKHTDMDYSIDN